MFQSLKWQIDMSANKKKDQKFSTNAEKILRKHNHET